MTSKDQRRSLSKAKQPLQEKTISTRDGKMLDWVFLQRKEFPNRRFYFDDSIKITMKKNMIGGIKMLGAAVEPFYDVEKVTHIITARLFKNENNENKEDEIKRCINETVAAATQSLLKKHTSTATPKTSTKRSFGTNITNKNVMQNDTTKKRAMGDIDLADAQRRGIKIWHVDKFKKILSRLLDTSSVDPPKVDHSFLQSSSTDVAKPAKNQIFSIIVGDSAHLHRPIISRQYLGEEHLISFHFDIPYTVSPFQTYSKKKSIQTKLSASLSVANNAVPANAQANPPKDGDQEQRENEVKRIVLPLKDESGYCEYCSVKYESLAQHRQSFTHVEFKRDNSRFKDLDDLLMEL
ncbi:34560_t:CDS:2 [Racocetra persica]|uniref:34560_t:CDS:1 n=1 Tax=Racocetra persica TaxID=160502 RepID=A0ACA9Q5T3_9GLOM|nr:34560_t:CDS:2 [Racocetra persica]